MASEAKYKDFRDVRIPAGLYTGVDDYLSALKLRILEAAARRASARQTSAGPSAMAVEDVVQSANQLFQAAAAELERTLRQQNTKHVRNAS